MILAGTDPIYAAVYQFAVIAMIFAASGLASVISVLLARGKVFSSAEQLILKPAAPAQPDKKAQPGRIPGLSGSRKG